MDTAFITTAVISYLLGSIPFGLLFAKLLGKDDLRTQGSGNIGATNAYRVGGKLLGGLTLAFDFLKGIAAMWYASSIDPSLQYLAAIMVVIGHIFPIWLKFRGGKGVATTLAVVLFLNQVAGLICIGLWISVYKLLKVSSVASISSMLFTALISLMFLDIQFSFVVSFLAALIVLRHYDNIKRLMAGKER